MADLIHSLETSMPMLLTRKEMEARRLLAAQEFDKGVSQAGVARKLGVSRTSASRWQRALTGQGPEALKRRKAPGRPNRLTDDQRAQLVARYQRTGVGPGVAPWTTREFTGLILELYGVRYNSDHVGRLLHRLGIPTRKHGRVH